MKNKMDDMRDKKKTKLKIKRRILRPVELVFERMLMISPGQFKWTRRFRWKPKSSVCACAVKFQKCSAPDDGCADTRNM